MGYLVLVERKDGKTCYYLFSSEEEARSYREDVAAVTRAAGGQVKCIGGTRRALARRASTSPAQSRTSWPKRSSAISHLAASKVTPSTPASRVATIPIRIGDRCYPFNTDAIPGRQQESRPTPHGGC